MTRELELRQRFDLIQQNTERTPDTSVKLYDAAQLSADMAKLLPKLTTVTADALGKTPDYMDDVVNSFTFLLAIKKGDEIIGYGGYEIESVPEVGVLLDESKMIGKEAQGKGFGSKLTQMAMLLCPADYLVFTSQNPSQIQSARKALQGKKLAPIDISYADSPELSRALEKTALHRNRIIEPTGKRPDVYFGQRFGDYKIDPTNPEIAFIEKRLSATGFDRKSGDGVFFMAKLK